MFYEQKHQISIHDVLWYDRWSNEKQSVYVSVFLLFFFFRIQIRRRPFERSIAFESSLIKQFLIRIPSCRWFSCSINITNADETAADSEAFYFNLKLLCVYLLVELVWCRAMSVSGVIYGEIRINQNRKWHLGEHCFRIIKRWLWGRACVEAR